MTQILTPLLTDNIDDCRYVRLIQPFRFQSDVLAKYGLKSIVEAPIGFVQDFESVPIVKGTSKRAGTAHDYLCRIDSDPIVTKAIAAEVYREILNYCHTHEINPHTGLYVEKGRSVYEATDNWFREWGKWGVVYVWPGYFHKYKVLATYEEIIA